MVAPGGAAPTRGIYTQPRFPPGPMVEAVHAEGLH